MEFKYVMTPTGMGKKSDMEAAVKTCRYFRMEDVPVSPVLAFSFLEGEEWLMNWLSKELLKKSSKVMGNWDNQPVLRAFLLYGDRIA